jgi:hypothetical protein
MRMPESGVRLTGLASSTAVTAVVPVEVADVEHGVRISHL